MDAIAHERAVLQEAMTAARRRLAYFRAEGDELNRDLTEAELNAMLERWERLAPEATEATNV